MTHQMTLWATDKLSFMKQYWCRNVSKASKEVYETYTVCPKINTGKVMQIALSHFYLPSGHLRLGKLIFIQLPLLKVTRMFL